MKRCVARVRLLIDFVLCKAIWIGSESLRPGLVTIISKYKVSDLFLSSGIEAEELAVL